jgi:hypothetical protein
MARPKKQIDYLQFQKLYDMGYHDAAIARILGVDRSTVTRRRQAINLPPNRRRGERGPSIRQNEPYWMAVRRCLQYVGNYVREAARQYYKETGDFERFFICFVLEPKPMFHGVLSPYAPDPARMNLKSAQKIVEFEQAMEMTSMAGVPGPAILELAEVYKSADEETCQRLARQAVETAGLVNCHTRIADIDKQQLLSPKDFWEYWKKKMQEAFSWVPFKQWHPVKSIRKATRKAKEAIRTVATVAQGRAGKRRKQGGLQSLHDYRAFQGALGY